MLQRKLRNQEEHEEVDFLIQKKQKWNDGDGLEESILPNPSAEAGLCQSSERKRRSQSKYQDKNRRSSDDYQIWDYGEFRKRLPLSRDTFEYI